MIKSSSYSNLFSCWDESYFISLISVLVAPPSVAMIAFNHLIRSIVRVSNYHISTPPLTGYYLSSFNVASSLALVNVSFKYVVKNCLPSVSKPLRLHVVQESPTLTIPVVEDAPIQESFYRSNGLKCRFNFLWPILVNLHKWISYVWKRLPRISRYASQLSLNTTMNSNDKSRCALV